MHIAMNIALWPSFVISNTVQPVLKGRPIDYKSMVCQDRWSLVTGSFALLCWTFHQELCGPSRHVLCHVKWSLKAGFTVCALVFPVPQVTHQQYQNYFCPDRNRARPAVISPWLNSHYWRSYCAVDCSHRWPSQMNTTPSNQTQNKLSTPRLDQWSGA